MLFSAPRMYVLVFLVSDEYIDPTWWVYGLGFENNSLGADKGSFKYYDISKYGGWVRQNITTG